MHLNRAIVIGVLLCGGAASTEAQQRDNAAPQIDVSRLPIDLERIQRQLRASTVREEQDGLSLRYQVEVFGQAPDIVFFTPEANLTTGPVPYGAPTHREMIDHVTPKEFRSPVMDFNALFKWLAEKAKE